MSKTKLVAGPWVGEFGWELFAWQGYVRALSRNFDETIVISRKNSMALYEDFCDEFITFNPPNNLADSFFMQNFNTNDALIKIFRGNKIPLDKYTTIFTPRRIGNPPHTHYSEKIQFNKYIIRPEYIKFGKQMEKNYDYVFHIRNRKLRSEDNWSIENWKKLLELLDSDNVACIGTKGESGHIAGTQDLRDITLSETFDVLRNTKCLFGPSSGPMHLSSLCGCPHFVWSRKENYTRYTENWNPLKTKVLFDSTHSWHPSPQYVFEEFTKWIS